jgi:hypothetical protein
MVPLWGVGEVRKEDLELGDCNFLCYSLANSIVHPGNEFEGNPGRNERDCKRSVGGTRMGRMCRTSGRGSGNENGGANLRTKSKRMWLTKFGRTGCEKNE